MSTEDQNYTLPSQGQSDWDTDLNANLTITARGHHVLATAGVDINTGQLVTVTSDGYALLYDPNSLSSFPHLFAYKAVSSGEQDTFLRRGIVRSLDVLTPAIIGEPIFGDAASPGTIASSYSGADRAAGLGVYEDGVYFDPGKAFLPETLTRSVSVDAVTGSSHFFTLDGGRGGFVRQLIAIGDSADLVDIYLWTNSARDNLLYATFSGGVSVVGSFLDQAGFPYWNTDASTINGLIYGTMIVNSDAAVGSDTIGLSCVFERFK